jgi:hypothetical protein
VTSLHRFVLSPKGRCNRRFSWTSPHDANASSDRFPRRADGRRHVGAGQLDRRSMAVPSTRHRPQPQPPNRHLQRHLRWQISSFAAAWPAALNCGGWASV